MHTGGYVLASGWYRKSLIGELTDPSNETIASLKRGSCTDMIAESLGVLLTDATARYLSEWRSAQIERLREVTCTVDGLPPPTAVAGSESRRRRRLVGGRDWAMGGDDADGGGGGRRDWRRRLSWDDTGSPAYTMAASGHAGRRLRGISAAGGDDVQAQLTPSHFFGLAVIVCSLIAVAVLFSKATRRVVAQFAAKQNRAMVVAGDKMQRNNSLLQKSGKVASAVSGRFRKSTKVDPSVQRLINKITRPAPTTGEWREGVDGRLGALETKVDGQTSALAKILRRLDDISDEVGKRRVADEPTVGRRPGDLSGVEKRHHVRNEGSGGGGGGDGASLDPYGGAEMMMISARSLKVRSRASSIREHSVRSAAPVPAGGQSRASVPGYKAVALSTVPEADEQLMTTPTGLLIDERLARARMEQVAAPTRRRRRSKSPRAPAPPPPSVFSTYSDGEGEDMYLAT